MPRNKDESTLTLRVVHTRSPKTFWVCVSDKGVPDFRIKARNAQSAADALANYIYNELDGREDIMDGEAENNL